MYKHESNGNAIEGTEIAEKDTHFRVTSLKNYWEAKEALTKFSTPLMLQLQTYNVLYIHKVEVHNSNHKIMLVISDTAA